jgi:hypothetical protein
MPRKIQVIKRLFCISRINFVTPSSNYQTTSSDQQVPPASASVSAVNPYVLELGAVVAYPALPMRDGLGQCATTTLRNLNNIASGKCRVSVASTAAIATNALLNPASFAIANGLTAASLRVFRM